jgi:transglutaminase-like putative cysteine protease
VLLVVACGLLWLLAASRGPLESAGLVIERALRPAAAAQRAVSSHRGPVSGNWLWNEQTRRPLPRRTDFKPGRKPEVFLRLANPADAEPLLADKVYVRSFALGLYQQSTWAPLPGRPLKLEAETDGFTRIAAPRPGREIVHEVFHAKDPAGRSPLTALQGATAAAVSPLERVDDGLHLLPPPTETGGYRYLAKSTSLRIDDLPDDALLRAWPGAAPELLEMPPQPGYGDLRAMAREAAGNGTVKEQLLRLQQHLRQSFDYSLETTNPRDLDPMENFLFHERRGHCEYFATAGALMARALGMPSRVAYGWAGGTWYAAAGLFVFRANEAHAWTEIWLENFGWVTMDPTPPAGGNDRARAAPPTEKPPIAEPETLEETADPSVAARTPPWLPAALTLGLLPVAIGLLAARARRAAGGPAAGNTDSSGTSRHQGYLAAWRAACAARGTPWRAGTTLRRHLKTLGNPPDFAAELVTYHYATTYEGRPADTSAERRLTRRIRAWHDGFSGINASSTASQQGP